MDSLQLCEWLLEQLVRALLVQRGGVSQRLHHIVQKAWVHQLVVVLGLRSVAEHDVLGFGWIGWQHPPVDEGSVSDVGIVDLFGGHCQQLADESLELLWILDVHFDGRADYFQLDDPLFSCEIGNPLLESCHRHIVDLLRVLPQNPHCCFLWLWLRGEIEQPHQVLEHAIEVVLRRILPQHVLSCLNIRSALPQGVRWQRARHGLPSAVSIWSAKPVCSCTFPLTSRTWWRSCRLRGCISWRTPSPPRSDTISARPAHSRNSCSWRFWPKFICVRNNVYIFSFLM